MTDTTITTRTEWDPKPVTLPAVNIDEQVIAKLDQLRRGALEVLAMLESINEVAAEVIPQFIEIYAAFPGDGASEDIFPTCGYEHVVELWRRVAGAAIAIAGEDDQREYAQPAWMVRYIDQRCLDVLRDPALKLTDEERACFAVNCHLRRQANPGLPAMTDDELAVIDDYRSGKVRTDRRKVRPELRSRL